MIVAAEYTHCAKLELTCRLVQAVSDVCLVVPEPSVDELTQSAR